MHVFSQISEVCWPIYSSLRFYRPRYMSHSLIANRLGRCVSRDCNRRQKKSARLHLLRVLRIDLLKYNIFGGVSRYITRVYYMAPSIRFMTLELASHQRCLSYFPCNLPFRRWCTYSAAINHHLAQNIYTNSQFLTYCLISPDSSRRDWNY